MRTEICQRSMHAFPCGCKAVKIMFLCVSNLFQDKSADTNQSHGLTHGPAANSRRLGPKGASATFKPFMHFLFSTLVKLQSLQMIRCFSLARSSSSVSASRQHRAHCSSAVTLKVWLFYRRMSDSGASSLILIHVS